MDGLDPAIGYPGQIANDAIPVSNHPMEMTGPVMTRLDSCARYVNSKGRWYEIPGDKGAGVTEKRPPDNIAMV